jgi:hypothetical protein
LQGSAEQAWRQLSLPLPLTPPHTNQPTQIENPLLRRAAKAAAIYRAALRPRLLVPVGLASSIAVWNALSDAPLSLLYEGCVMGGFLAYKGALLTKLLQELLPKVGLGCRMLRACCVRVCRIPCMLCVCMRSSEPAMHACSCAPGSAPHAPTDPLFPTNTSTSRSPTSPKRSPARASR